jgi:hypothetical protein
MSKVFPKGNLSKSCVIMRWSGVRLMGMGFMTHKGLYCLICGSFVLGVLPFFRDATFFQAHLFAINLLKCFQV